MSVLRSSLRKVSGFGDIVAETERKSCTVEVRNVRVLEEEAALWNVPLQVFVPYSLSQ